MKIAICDNDTIILKHLEKLIEDYIDSRNHNDITYKTFTSYESVLDEIDNFDLFMLDYNMNDDSINPDTTDKLTGMDFARIVRKKADPHKGILFITSYTDIMPKVFDVMAFNFITKPIEKDRLFEILDKYLDSIIASGTLVVKINSESHVIDVDSIYYFEVTRKDVFIHLEDEVLKCHKTIGEFEDELKPFNFFRTHRSFLVNVAKVKKINNRSAIMKNGEEIFVSKKYYSDFCEKFIDN